MNAIFEKIFPKPTAESIDIAALKRVEELKSAQFELSLGAVILAIVAPLACLTLGAIYSGLCQWICLPLAMFATIAAALIFRNDRSLVKTPRAIAAKVTRVVKRPPRGKG